MHRSRSASKSPRSSNRLVGRLLGPAERKPTALRRRLRSELLEDRRLLAGWTQQDHVFRFSDPIDPQALAEHGRSVAVDGDLMVVGAPREDHEERSGGLNAGAAYIYRRDDAGTPLDNSDDFWRDEARLTANDAFYNDNFGNSVSISGDTVVVGSYLDDHTAFYAGSAYVFSRGDDGTWSQQAKLTASDADQQDFFGWSVSVSGDTAVVGAYQNDDPTLSFSGDSSGSAYVFTRTGTSWTEEAKLTASDADAFDRFGYSVAVSDDTVVVGSPSDDDGADDSGSAYVFTRSGGSWHEDEKLTASDPTRGAGFSQSVSISEDTVVVGASSGQNAGILSGSAYVFIRSGTGWNQQAKLTASDGEDRDYFGSSVSVSGDIVVVGSPYDDDDGTDSGSAYVFTRSEGSWSEQTKLTASDAAADDSFGRSVSISGDNVVVGSPQHDIVKNGWFFAGAGSAYAFDANGGLWNQQDQVFAFPNPIDPRRFAEHGYSVAVDGDLMVVGAPNDETLRGTQGGSVSIYRRDDAGTPLNTGDDFWRDEARLIPGDVSSSDRFGYSVSISGETVVVGRWLDDEAASDAGAAYVFTLSNGTWSQQAKLIASDAADSDRFGNSVSVFGDTVVVGADDDDDAGRDSGSAYVFTRTGNSWTEQQKLTASDAAENDSFGYSVSVSGDTVVVGSRLDDDSGKSDSGSVYVFTRSEGTWSEQTKLTASDADFGDQFGSSVSISGDTVVTGTYRDDDAGFESGSAYVFSRSDGSWTEEAKLTASDAAAADRFGWSVSVSGDTVVVGSRYDDDAGTDSGSAYVFTRSDGSWTEEAKLTASDAAAGDHFGYAVAVSGATAVVGSPFDHVRTSITVPDAGSAYVFVPESIPVDYDFTSAAFAAAEGDATNTSHVVTLTRSDAAVAETVEVMLTGGTATAGSDFTAGPISVSFGVGEVTKPVPIEILGDQTVESDQSLRLSLTSFSEIGQVGTTIPTAMFTITNDDTAAITIADLSQDEESGTFTFKAILDNPVAGGFTVDYSIAGVDTESGDITSPLSGTLNFAGGAGESQNIEVTVDDDLIVEGDESFTVSLGTITPAGTPPVDAADVDTSDTATGTIVNTDKATISIADASVNEGSGGTTELVFTITSTNPSEEDLTVQVDTAEILGQALGGGVDFTDIVGGTATIAGDSVSTSTFVTVVLGADYFAEADETLEVNLSNQQFGGSSDPTRAELGDAQAIGTIVNDDSENSIVVGDCLCSGDLAGTKAIFVNGSSLDDKIDVKLGLVDGTFEIEIKTGSTKLVESVNPADHDAAVSTVVIYGLDGNDDIKIHGDVDGLRGFLFGGAGDDKIKGGKSDDVLIGGSGDDRLDGHQGRDILIGGTGADKINGEKDEDILVGGSTDYDNNHLVALCAILDEWTRRDNTFQDRVNNVFDGSGDPGALNGSFTLENHVQLGDGAVDDLRGGGSETDWFVASEADGDTYDQLKDGEAFWSDVESLFFET